MKNWFPHNTKLSLPAKIGNAFVTVKSKGALLRSRKSYRNALVLLALCSLLLLITVTVISTYYAETRKLLRSICTSEECLRSASDLHRSMDLTVDPCEDFYNFTCGRWDEVHPNDAWQSSFSIIHQIDRHVTFLIQKFFWSQSSEDELLPVKQSRWFFQSCMDEIASDKLGYTVLHKYLNETGLPPVPSFFATEAEQAELNFDWIKTSVALYKTLGVSMFAQFIVIPNNRNNTQFELHVSSGNTATRLSSQFNYEVRLKNLLKRSKTDYKINSFVQDGNGTVDGVEEDDTEIISAVAKLKAYWKECIKVVVENATKMPDEDKVEEAVDVIWEINSGIFVLSTGNYSSALEGDRPYTVQELQNITDECLQAEDVDPFEYYKPYLTHLFEGIEGSRFDFDRDVVYISEYEIMAVCKILAAISKTPESVLELYTWWTAVKVMIASTTTRMRDLEQLLVPGAKKDDKLSHCIDVVEMYMPLAITYGIVDKGFVNTTGTKVRVMLEEIKTAFIDRVRRLSWMDEDTKNSAIDKATAMMGFVGFPDWLLNKTALEAYYSNITISPTNFLENLLQFAKISVPSMLKTFKEPQVKNMVASPNKPNAFYYSKQNSIQIPMAFLTFPVYNLGLEVLNYGTFGSILGHEFIHGFDSSGRNFDKLGNYLGWWTNQTDHIFKEKARCFVEQYNNFYVEAINAHVDGIQTLAENLADNGGMNNAYIAYQSYKKKHGDVQYLPGFEQFTEDQMFFIAFASAWCSTSSLEFLDDQIRTDSHSPAIFRLLGTLQNSKDFSKAFLCKPGTNMNPKRKRCNIW